MAQVNDGEFTVERTAPHPRAWFGYWTVARAITSSSDAQRRRDDRPAVMSRTVTQKERTLTIAAPLPPIGM